MSKKLPNIPRVELWAKLTSIDVRAGQEIAAAGARSCFDKRSAKKIFDEDYSLLNKETLTKKLDAIFKKTSGRGHGSVLDQSFFTFVIEDLPRYATLFLCSFQYLSHLQQSLRRVNVKNGFVLSYEWQEEKSSFSDKKNGIENLLNEAFALYEEMNESKIPPEDARYVLPLATKTNILTSGNARELMHLDWLSEQETPSIVRKIVKEMVEKAKKAEPQLMKKRENNYEPLAWFPASFLFAKENPYIDGAAEKGGNIRILECSHLLLPEKEIEKAIKEKDPASLSNLKHMHYTFLAPMSLSSFHQAIRQRTWDQSVESIYRAAKREKIIVPPSIQNSNYRNAFENQCKKMIEAYHTLSSEIPPKEAITVSPHALEVYDLIHVNGWNAIHSIGKRTCEKAQWEIRDLAKKLAEEIKNKNPSLGKYLKPQGILYHKCPEKNSCGKCFRQKE